MKKIAAALLVLIPLLAIAASAKPIRVKFPPGRTTVVLKGRTTGGPSESGGMDPISYVLRARRGQRMTVHLTSAKRNAIFSVYAPGYDLIDAATNATDWTGTLRKNGDYEIIVFPEDEATNTNFTIEITIR